MGNLSAALGSGWSVEDGFAWAIGAESELTLPLQGDQSASVLRFDLHPALFPPKVSRQRLMIRAGKTVLGSFEVTERQTLVIPLPETLTGGATRLQLTIIHPDAVRPRDHLPVDDSRRLAICFHSASLAQAGPDAEQTSAASDGVGLETVHGIIAGDSTARRIAEVIGKLPSLKGRFGIRFLDMSGRQEQAVARLQPEAVETAQFCWLELNAGTPATRETLRGRLAEGCLMRAYYAPMIRSLWPFQGPDSRAVQEPGRHNPSRYPYGDRLGQTLAAMNMPGDVVYLMYDMAAEQDPVDLDEIFASDLRRWRAEGRKADVDLANFIEEHLVTSRLFNSPHMIGPTLLREMVRQILNDDLVRNLASHATLLTELDTLLDGYVGWQEDVPVHKRVARHFQLSWWSSDMKYRWINNLRTHREYTLDYIKWMQWRT